MPLTSTTTLTPVGKKLRQARLAKKINFSTLANETGLTIEYLKKVERGEATLSVGNLLQISRALEIDSGFLLSASENQKKDRVKAYTTRTDNYAYETLTPGAENKHLKAFRVKIEAGQNHSGVSYNHVGEEFVYVLRGNVQVRVGEHVNTIQQGGSLHFNSGIQHHLKNIGKSDAELIVVIYNS